MVEKVLQHKHCQVCGRAVPVDEIFCSMECEGRYNQYVKKQRRNNYIMLGIMVALVGGLLIMLYLG
jgi:predicted nucleic acid-binding Zn ribbon protein